MRFASLLLIPALLLAELPKLPEPYQSIADLANAAPAEFAADALLRMVESCKISDKDAKRELTAHAFQLAGSAKFRFRMRGLPGSMVDTRSGYLSKAYDLKLDALSLQSRAVHDMLTIDAGKARELFLEIVKPSLPPLTCDDPLVYDVADFYQTLGAVINAAFSPQERKKEEHVNLLLDYIAQTTSPAQLGPLARAIKTINLTAEQRAVVWTKFNGVL